MKITSILSFGISVITVFKQCVTLNCPAWNIDARENICFFGEYNELSSIIEPESQNFVETNAQVLENITKNVCELPIQTICALKRQHTYPLQIKSLKPFSNLLLLVVKDEFLSSLEPSVILPELNSPTRSTEVKIKLIRLIGQIDLFHLIDNVDPIHRPEALAILSRTPRSITHLNELVYKQMQLILTKGFRYDQLNLFGESSQYKEYLNSILTGIETGFKNEPLSCFESQKLFEFVKSMVQERKMNPRFFYDYQRSVLVWVKLWGQILPCVGTHETIIPKSRGMQIAEALVKTNPSTDFSENMGANLLLQTLQNAPAINKQNGEDFAYDSISHLWKYATYEHFRYIERARKYKQRSLESPRTIYNMFSQPQSLVFTIKLAELECNFPKELSCIWYYNSESREQTLRFNNFKSDLIPISSLSWSAKRQIANLIFTNQVTGIPMTSKLATLGGLISGLDITLLVKMIVRSKQSSEISRIILNEIENNGSYFGHFQKSVLIGNILNITSDAANLPEDFWEFLPFSRFLQASKTISKLNVKSIQEQFIEKPWRQKHAQVIAKDFELSFERRTDLSISTTGAWIMPTEIERFKFSPEIFKLIQSVSASQSSEYAFEIAQKIQQYYSSLKNSEFTFSLIEAPILASIPGKVLREFSISAFLRQSSCRELISKIAKLDDNHRFSDGRNQQLAHLFISNCGQEKKENLGKEVSEQLLYSMGSLVCYISPNYIRLTGKKILQNSLELFDQCCLTKNQSIAIKTVLLENSNAQKTEELSKTSPKLKYLKYYNLFCQVFDFDFSVFEIVNSSSNLFMTTFDERSAVYQLVNQGGILSGTERSGKFTPKDECAKKFKDEGRLYDVKLCHKNATALILLMEPETLKCNTLKILDQGENF